MYLPPRSSHLTRRVSHRNQPWRSLSEYNAAFIQIPPVFADVLTLPMTLYLAAEAPPGSQVRDSFSDFAVPLLLLGLRVLWNISQIFQRTLLRKGQSEDVFRVA